MLFEVVQFMTEGGRTKPELNKSDIAKTLEVYTGRLVFCGTCLNYRS